MQLIDVWYLPFQHENDFDLSKVPLSTDEWIAANRFKHTRDKSVYIQTHTALRNILNFYYPSVSPENWSFKTNKYGKPYICNSLSENLFFNLSHTSSCAYIICSSFEQCGIDVESIEDIDLTEELLNSIMHSNEKHHFLNHPASSLFYTLWTLKEAYLKALGKGLSIPPSSLDFSKYISQFPSFTTPKGNNVWTYINNGVALSYVLLNTPELTITTPKIYNYHDIIS